MKSKIYYQDLPIDNYEDDHIGFKEEVNMLKESIDSKAKVIGLISDYGSGKSTIIKLLENDTKFKRKNKIIRVNLLDPDANNEKFEVHKRMLLQFASQKYKRNQMKLSYINKRLNPNYRLLKLSTKKKSTIIFFIISLILFIVSFFYKNGTINQIEGFNNEKFELLNEYFSISPIIGFLIITCIALTDEIVFSYTKNKENNELSENDLIDTFYEVNKTIRKKNVIIIEDLDRLSLKQIEQFLKEIYSYYSNFKKYVFIVAITPEEFENIKIEKNYLDEKSKLQKDIQLKEGMDENYKLFNSIISLPNIKITDYEVILKSLLFDKKEILQSKLSTDVEKNYAEWLWLARGNDLNIRKLKHRLNETIHLYLTLKERFPNKDVNLKSCIAITYLKNTYKDKYLKLVEENNYSFKLKKIIEYFIINNNLDNEPNLLGDENIDLKNDLFQLINNCYIDYNCEMYCFNYSKENIIFDIYENQIYNCFLYDRSYSIDNVKIENILEKNNNCLLDAINIKLNLDKKLPKNIFDRIVIFDYVFKNISEEDRKIIMLEMLPINQKYINITYNRLEFLKTSSVFNYYLHEYFQLIKEDFRENTDLNLIPAIRLRLLKLYEDNQTILDQFYDEFFPEITDDELKSIKDFEIMKNLINLDLLNKENFKYIVKNIDRVFNDRNLLYDWLKLLDAELIDYFCKNSSILKKFNIEVKKEFYNMFKDYIKTDNLNEIKGFINNIELSFEELENKAIYFCTEGIISKIEYSKFVNELPNVSESTLNYLCSDDFTFIVSEQIVEAFKENKNYYGYLKFKTFNDNLITFIDRPKFKKEYEKIYSNKNSIFDNYFKDSYEVLNYLRDNMIYAKYDSIYLKNMGYCSQNFELLNYVFSNITDIKELNEYLQKIPKIMCSEEEMLNILTNYKTIFSKISNVAYKNIRKNIKSQKIKNKLYNLISNRKKPVVK